MSNVKATLVCKPHSKLPNTNVFEVHYGGQLVCTVTGADGPGVRVISKHAANIQKQPPRHPIPGVTQILFDLDEVLEKCSRCGSVLHTIDECGVRRKYGV